MCVVGKGVWMRVLASFCNQRWGRRSLKARSNSTVLLLFENTVAITLTTNAEKERCKVIRKAMIRN